LSFSINHYILTFMKCIVLIDSSFKSLGSLDSHYILARKKKDHLVLKNYIGNYKCKTKTLSMKFKNILLNIFIQTKLSCKNAWVNNILIFSLPCMKENQEKLCGVKNMMKWHYLWVLRLKPSSIHCNGLITEIISQNRIHFSMLYLKGWN